MGSLTLPAQISGVYGLAIGLDCGRPLAGSPFQIRVRSDDTIAANCKLYGPQLSRGVAGEQTVFSIQGEQLDAPTMLGTGWM